MWIGLACHWQALTGRRLHSKGVFPTALTKQSISTLRHISRIFVTIIHLFLKFSSSQTDFGGAPRTLRFCYNLWGSHLLAGKPCSGARTFPAELLVIVVGCLQCPCHGTLGGSSAANVAALSLPWQCPLHIVLPEWWFCHKPEQPLDR